MSPSSAPAPYHTAYRGRVHGPDGRFDHFLRQPDNSHFEGGYWRFQSYDDDRRAHSRGFTSPEDVLLAHGHGGEQHDDVIIRWVRGMNNSSYHMALSGTAAQHLQAIIDIRGLLKMPRSFRGQIPIYPQTADPRVKQYWDRTRSAQQQARIDPALTSPGQPTPSPITPRSEQASTPQGHVSLQQVQVPPEGRVTRTRGAQTAQTKPAVRATPPQRSPATHVRPTQLSGKSPLNWQVKSQVQLPQAAPPNAPWLSSRPPGTTANSGQDVGRTPRTISTAWPRPHSEALPASGQGISQHDGLDVGRAPRTNPALSRQGPPSQMLSNSGHGISQHNWVHQPSQSSTSYTPYDPSNPVQLQQQAPPRPSTDPRLADRRPGTPATACLNTPFTSSVSRSQHEGSLGTSTNGAATPLGSPAEQECVLTPAQLAVLTPLPEHLTSVEGRSGNAPSRYTNPLVPATASPAQCSEARRPSTPLSRPSTGSLTHTPTHRPSPNGFFSPVAAPASSPRTVSGARPVATPSSPHTPRTATTKSTIDRQRSDATQNGHSSPVVRPLSSSVRPSQGAFVASPITRKSSIVTPVQPTAPVGARQESRREAEDGEGPVAPASLKQDELDAQAFSQAVDMFGCMDCGEDIGHKPGCGIGNLKRLANPTVLDLRSISDAVNHFDPTPAKRTHFNQFPTPPEDAETQVKGIANIIKGEDSYKEDAELAGLPDGVMVMLWAFKQGGQAQVLE